jgi:hypothetical protein
MIDYANILTRKFLGKLWNMDGLEYDGIEWLDSSKQPTKAELDKLWPAVQNEMKAEADARVATRKSAEAKLEKLGLTVSEIESLLA